MNICVCVKQIRQTYARTGYRAEKHFLNPEDAVCRINPHDEAALALALEIKAGHPGTRVLLLTLGPLLAEEALRRCLALGADRLVRIRIGDDTPFDIEPDPWCKSDLLARAVRMMEGDLVLCGKHSLDNQNGVVPAFMAHHLGLPLVSGVTVLEMVNGGRRVRVRCRAGRGAYQIVESALPAVLSVDAGAAVPATPTMARMQQARSQAIETIAFADFQVPAKTIPLGISAPHPRTKVIHAPDSAMPAFERVAQLMSGSRTAKKGKMVTGPAHEQVEAMVEFLRTHGFIEADN